MNSLRLLRIFCFCVYIFSFSEAVLAHGMNKPGPNQGYIRMPGMFHTELVEKNDHFLVYLLDIQFKNPTTKNSQVTLTFHEKKQSNVRETQVKCIPEKNSYFLCKAKKISKKNLFKISIQSTREKALGEPANYDFPLSFR